MICLECSGAHRGLGVHLSFVRSLTMDTWTPKQVSMMKEGGNAKLNKWWSKHGLASSGISAKYGSAAGQLYRERLVAKVEGRPLPTELPKQTGLVSTVYDASTGDTMSAGGFGATNKKGVEPLSGESEADYVARQRRLQAEARARMQAKFGAGGLRGVGSDSNYDPKTGSYGGGGGLDDTVSAISGGLRRLGSGAVEAVGHLGDRETVSAATQRVRGAWGGVVDRVSSIREGVSENDGIKDAAVNSWAAIRGLGASIGARVGEVAQRLATPEDDGLAGMLAERKGQLGSGKQMEGLGSAQHEAAMPGIDDLLSQPRDAVPRRVPRELDENPLTPPPPPPSRVASEPANGASSSAARDAALKKKSPPPREPEKDFFESFGV